MSDSPAVRPDVPPSAPSLPAKARWLAAGAAGVLCAVVAGVLWLVDALTISLVPPVVWGLVVAAAAAAGFAVVWRLLRPAGALAAKVTTEAVERAASKRDVLPYGLVAVPPSAAALLQRSGFQVASGQSGTLAVANVKGGLLLCAASSEQARSGAARRALDTLQPHALDVPVVVLVVDGPRVPIDGVTVCTVKDLPRVCQRAVSR